MNLHLTLETVDLLTPALGIAVAGAWLIGSIMVRWRRYPPFTAAIAPASDLTIPTPDGLSIAASFWPGATSNSPGVLLIHGLGDSRQAMVTNANWFASQGYAVLTIDLRGHGKSSRALHSFGLHESIDAQAACDWLKERQQGAPVGVIGISLGGAASLLNESGPIRSDALVLQAVFPDLKRAVHNRIAAFFPRPFAHLLGPLITYQSLPRLGVWPNRLAPIAALALYEGPVLIIGGEQDRYTPPSESIEMMEAAPQRSELHLLQGMDHPQASSAQSDEYRERILAFFSATLCAPEAEVLTG